ncbi:oligosaccharide flippase family protein [Pantoea sp. Mb-10]|uniref:oligosaccharide flippase family protein n=1 Tax=unclassified Pantoea TaxID=2630326 RepID=UPI001E5EC2D5|nr:oligosaccharide flippase family protein [Pantoea sp. Mb-10]MCE0503640.1 oligosaccharide flippase family protein [Pantoea sp. Pb-8]
MKDKLKNSMWMIAEKLIAIFGLIFVTSYVAKYVGPTTFGIISIAMLVFQFIQSVAIMGSDVILLKRIAQNRRSGIRLMMTTFMLVMVIYSALAAGGMAIMGETWSRDALVFVIAAALACLFSSLDLVNIYNEAMLNARLNVIANVIGLAISLGVRFFISYYALNPQYLAIPIVLATLLPFSIKLLIFMRHQRHAVAVPPRRHLKKYTRYMLASGISLVFSVIAIAIYTRVNQLSVSYFLGVKEAGIFAVAMTLSTAWVFLPNALLASFFPAFFAERDDAQSIVKAQKLHLLVVGVSGVVILAIWLLSGWFIRHFYGEAYLDAVAPTLLLSVGAMCGVLSSLMDRFIIKYNGYRFLVKKTFVVLLVCLASSVALVPVFGLTGAAMSVVITEFVSFSLLNYFFSAQPVIRIHQVFFNPRKLWLLLTHYKTSDSKESLS